VDQAAFFQESSMNLDHSLGAMVAIQLAISSPTLSG